MSVLRLLNGRSSAPRCLSKILVSFVENVTVVRIWGALHIPRLRQRQQHLGESVRPSQVRASIGIERPAAKCMDQCVMMSWTLLLQSHVVGITHHGAGAPFWLRI